MADLQKPGVGDSRDIEQVRLILLSLFLFYFNVKKEKCDIGILFLAAFG
jgi:hypothetical protein